MKILLIATMPPPVTGQSLAVKIFHDVLIKRHEVEVIDLSKNSFRNGLNSCARIAQVLRIYKKIWFKKELADVIYFTVSESIAGNIKDLLIYLICYRSLHKMIIHLHGGAGMRNILLNNKSLLNLINRYFVRKLGKIIVLGKYHVDTYSNIVPSDKVCVVPNFAEDYLFINPEEIPNKFQTTQPLRLLFLSNLIPGKGYNELLDAYLALSDNLKEKIIIDFAGGFESETQKAMFLNRIQGHGQLFYHGIVGGAVKNGLFKRAHVFCLPTYYPYEGQPISILEAYASGCVVMTTNHSGIPDIFRDRINGFEVQKKSSGSIKIAIEQMIEKPNQLLSLALTNRKIADAKYRTSIYNDNLLNIIENFPHDTRS